MTEQLICHGNILPDELEALDINAAELARLIEVPSNRISQILAGKRKITVDTALRFSHYFGTSTDFWMNLEKDDELEVARAKIGPELNELPNLPRQKIS